MTATHPEQAEQYPAHFEPPRGAAWRLFFGPGLVRGAWMALLGFGLGTALVCLLRAWWGWDPVWNTEVVLVVGAMVVGPIFFLAGIGSFERFWASPGTSKPTSNTEKKINDRVNIGTGKRVDFAENQAKW